MSVKPWRHSAGDGRGPRQVFLNGEPIYRVVYADERRGIVKVQDNPVRVTRAGNVRVHTKRGRVEVRFL